MRTRISLVVCSLGLAGVLAACTGGGGGGGGFTITAGNVSGFVVVGAGADFALGQAVFYSGVATGDPNESFTLEFETDDCELPIAEPGTANEVTFNYLDVGSTVTFEGGTLTIVANRDTSDGIVYFNFASPGDPNAANWTVTNSGTPTVPAGTIANVEVPTALEYAGAGSLTPGQPEEVTWTGATGANYVSIEVYDVNDEFVYSCAPKNDGAFTIPAEVTTAAGTGGYFDISATRYETTSFQGKTLLVVSVGL